MSDAGNTADLGEGDDLDDDDLDDDLDDDDLDDDEELEDELDTGDDGVDGLAGAYEPGDINTVAGGADYEAGDINTVVPASRERSAGGDPLGAPERAPARGGGGDMPTTVLEYLAQSLADEPDAVTVRREDRRGSVVLKLHVAPGDMGRIIGRRGRTAQAIRTLVGAAGARAGVQAAVDIVDD